MQKKTKILISSIVAIVVFLMITYSCNKGNDSNTPLPEPIFSEPVTDIDGNVYKTVVIDNQIWMAENLRTTKYRNGEPVPNWGAVDNKTGAYLDYDNNVNNSTTYGRLYNWYAVTDSRNIAPLGWHIPTNDEWTTLQTVLGGASHNDGGKLKEAGTTHWSSPNTGATNETGFTALPGGSLDNSFGGLGTTGYWWSNTLSEYNFPYFAWYWYLDHNGDYFGSHDNNYRYLGLSVRCIKGNPTTIPTLITTEASDITTISAISGGKIISEGGVAITERGVCYNTSQVPTISNSKILMGNGIGTFSNTVTGLIPNTTYYMRAYATNSIGTAYGGEVSFTTYTAGSETVTDIEGNVYHTVKIGSQTWLVENLKTTKYNDGTSIPNVTNFTSWKNLTTPGYCWYDNEITNKSSYGALYNWYTVNTGKLAPIGWHVPTDVEWTALTNYVSTHLGTSGSVAKALASATGLCTTSTLTGAVGNDLTKNNSTGFTALPGGSRFSNGDYNGRIFEGQWWSNSEDNNENNNVYNSRRYAWSRFVGYDRSNVSRYGSYMEYGLSVRCVKD